jgi:hypothetical protein
MHNIATKLPDGRRKNGGKREPCGGRPRWRPAGSQRAFVEEAAGRGVPQEVIAMLLGISKSTLRRHCASELRFGAMAADLRVAATAYEMAISGKHPQMTWWWLTTRSRW